jgi:hypothetical protein
MEFQDYEGARRSVALHKRLLTDLKLLVEKTAPEGDYVATGWTLTVARHPSNL